MFRHRYTRAVLLAAAVSAFGAHGAWAQALPMIDNFSTGPVDATLNGAHQTATLDFSGAQTGTKILGGQRVTGLELLQSANPFFENASVRIEKTTPTVTGGLVVSQGFQADAVASVDYGLLNGDVGTSLNANLSVYNRFRVSFLALDGGVLMDILAYSGTVNSEWGCNVPASIKPISVDFPLANAYGTANLSDVSALIFEFQSSGGAFGNSFGISKIAMVSAGAPAGDVTCPAITPG